MGVNERQRQARQQARKGMSLRQKVITSGLHKRYTLAASRILSYWQESRVVPSAWEDFDLATCEWLQHIFAEGLPKGYGSDGIAALQHFVPEVSGKLRASWRLLRTWQKLEPPVRVMPLSPLMVTAMASLCITLGYPGLGAGFLVAFDAFLRPGELYSLTVGDVIWASGRATLTLRAAKTGQRKGAEEMVFVNSKLATKWLKAACRNRSPSDTIIQVTPEHCRHVLFTLLDTLQVPGHLSMYSFRRGGATWFFVQERSLETTLLRGRWASTSTARIYLQDSAASLIHCQLAPAVRHTMKELTMLL